jgi:ribosome maturation factor RimP
MRFEEKIITLLGPALETLGYEIVLVHLRDTKRKVIELIIDRLDGQAVSIDDCVNASREAALHLDVAEVIDDAYLLEVSSPGLDRPLVQPEHFKRVEGQQIKLKTFEPIGEGRQKKFKGTLTSVTEAGIVLDVEDGVTSEGETKVNIAFSNIEKANLIASEVFGKKKK